MPHDRPGMLMLLVVLTSACAGGSPDRDQPEEQDSVLIDSTRLVEFAEGHAARIPWWAKGSRIPWGTRTIEVQDELVGNEANPPVLAVQGSLLDVWRTPKGVRGLVGLSFLRHKSAPSVFFDLEVPSPLVDSLLATPSYHQHMFALVVDSVAGPRGSPQVTVSMGDTIVEFEPARPDFFMAWGRLVTAEAYGAPWPWPQDSLN